MSFANFGVVSRCSKLFYSIHAGENLSNIEHLLMLFSLPQTAARLTVTEHRFSLISIVNALWCLFSVYTIAKLLQSYRLSKVFAQNSLSNSQI